LLIIGLDAPLPNGIHQAIRSMPNILSVTLADLSRAQ
jgi:hypothetical protein